MVIHAQDYVSITLKDGDTCTRLCIKHLKKIVIHAQDYVSITLKDGDNSTRLCINHLKRWWYMHNTMYQSH